MPVATAYHKGISKELSAALVYQGGIANVFVRAGEGLDASEWTRVKQGDFASCEQFALGMRCAGAYLTVWHWDGAGDCTDKPWNIGAGELFHDTKAKL